MSLCVLLCVFEHTCVSHFKWLNGLNSVKWIESVYQGVCTRYTCLGGLECLGTHDFPIDESWSPHCVCSPDPTWPVILPISVRLNTPKTLKRRGGSI